MFGATVFASTHQSQEPVQQAYTGPVELDLNKDNLLKLVNEERAKNGAEPLKLDATLNQSAQWKADDMAEFKYFSHKKPGEKLMNGLEYLDARDDGRCTYISENLHEENDYYVSATSSVNGWISSKPHHEAMIDPEYTLTGFGYATADGKTKVVEHFCKPL